MKVLTQLNENFGLSLALGYFDGLHKGHQKVILNAVDYAKTLNKKSAVITFKDHPCCYFWGVSPKYILTREERRNKIAELGVDFLYELDFKDFFNISADNYLKDILIKYFSPIAISTGFNHNFGYNKEGNTCFLKDKSSEFGYKYFMIQAETCNNCVISSTKIRELLACGFIEEATEMLGYNFSVSGYVIDGQKLGRVIGFRTANITYPNELIELPSGAYYTKICHNGNIYPALTNFGVKPTVSDSNVKTLEAHILNFNENIYGQNIKIEFIKKLRDEQKFSSIDELKSQIMSDIKYVKRFC